MYDTWIYAATYVSTYVYSIFLRTITYHLVVCVAIWPGYGAI